MSKYARHPLSAAWPDMSSEEFQSLCDSIENNGLRDPIVLLDDQVLDGWHRYTACVQTGIEPTFAPFDGDDPVQFISDKHNRRSLSLTQRITAITLMHKWAPRGRPEIGKGAPGAYLTNAAVAEKVGGSETTAKQVKAAIKNGSPELVRAMQDGKVSAKRAAEIAKLPQNQQAAAISEPPKAKPAKVEPAAPTVAPPPEDYSDLDAAHDQIGELQASLALANMGTVAEADKNQAAELIESLRAEVKTLQATLRATQIARDTLMTEVAQMKRQLQMQRKEIDKAKAPA